MQPSRSGRTHISLLYTIDEHGKRPGWWSSGKKLPAIAEEFAALIEAKEFVLGDPVIVAPDGDWTKITLGMSSGNCRRAGGRDRD